MLDADDKRSNVDSPDSLIGFDAGCRQTLLSVVTQCCCFPKGCFPGSYACFYVYWRSSQI